MPLETFTVVNGTAGLAQAQILIIDPAPTFVQSMGSGGVIYITFTVPAGDKSDISLNVLSATAGGSISDPVIKRSNQIVDAVDDLNLIYVLEGVHALSVDGNGKISILEVNSSSNSFRVSNPELFPSEITGVNVSTNGQISDTLFIATVIRGAQPPETIQPTTGGAPTAPPYDRILFPAFTIAIFIDGKIFVETLAVDPPEEDPDDGIQPDQGTPLIPDLDYSVSLFRSLTAGEIDSDTTFFLVTASVKNVSAVTGLGAAINFFRVDPDIGDVFLTSGSIIGLQPGEVRSVSTGITLRASADLDSLAPNTYTIKAQLGNSIIPNVVPVAYTDADSTNDFRTISIRLLAPGEAPTVLPPPSTSGSGGSGSSNNFSASPTGNQINVVVDDSNSQSLYDIQLGDEYQSNWIETNLQATRVAESIIWQRNQVLTATFTVPYNPDIRRGLTMFLQLNRIGFSMMGLVKSVGHTFSGADDRPVATQIVIRGTEYIFESSLALLGQEVFDRRQVIATGSLVVPTSF